MRCELWNSCNTRAQTRFIYVLVQPNGQHQCCQQEREGWVFPAAGENPPEDQPGVIDILGSEEDPGEHYDQEREHLFDQHGTSIAIECGLFQRSGQDPSGGMHRSPEHEGPHRSMPQPRDKHGEHHVQVSAKLAVTIPTQRNVDIVAKPSRQTDVPPLPEITQPGRQVRVVEIQHQADAKQPADPASHIGIAAEIKIDLPGEGERGQRQCGSLVLFWFGVDRGDVQRQVVGQGDFLEQPHDEQATTRPTRPHA